MVIENEIEKSTYNVRHRIQLNAILNRIEGRLLFAHWTYTKYMNKLIKLLPLVLNYSLY